MQTSTLVAPSAIVQESSGETSDPGHADAANSFDRMAFEDFKSLGEFDEGMQWADYGPAYAVGLATYEACVRHGGQMTEQELRDQWEQMRGLSHLEWEQVQEVIARSWAALAGLERAGVEVVKPDRDATTEVADTGAAEAADAVAVQEHSDQD